MSAHIGIQKALPDRRFGSSSSVPEDLHLKAIYDFISLARSCELFYCADKKDAPEERLRGGRTGGHTLFCKNVISITLLYIFCGVIDFVQKKSIIKV